LERNQIGTRDNFDIEMAARLDEFWGEDAHRAIVGWKSLIQLCHHPANGRRGLQKVNIVTGFSKIKRGLNPGNPPSNHQDSTYFVSHHIPLAASFETKMSKFARSDELKVSQCQMKDKLLNGKKNNPPSSPFKKGGAIYLLPFLKGGWEGLKLFQSIGI
jgi:hypothetical protein